MWSGTDKYCVFNTQRKYLKSNEHFFFDCTDVAYIYIADLNKDSLLQEWDTCKFKTSLQQSYMDWIFLLFYIPLSFCCAYVFDKE